MLTAKNLACRRGERLVFRDISFEVTRGGALLLVGPNGSGKSSLLRVLAGLTRLEAGQLFWEGQPVAKDETEYRSQLHFVGHQDSVKPVLTVAANLAFWARMHGARETDIELALARVRLAHLADWPARFLSAGQRRRLALARLLAAPAPIWLLDEPTTGLDQEAVTEFEAAVAAHRAGGGLVIASTHQPLNLHGVQTLTLGRR